MVYATTKSQAEACTASEPNLIVLFDGLCNLCCAAVDFIIAHDRRRAYSLLSAAIGSCTPTTREGAALPRQHRCDRIYRKWSLLLRVHGMVSNREISGRLVALAVRALSRTAADPGSRIQFDRK